MKIKRKNRKVFQKTRKKKKKEKKKERMRNGFETWVLDMVMILAWV